ncbi:MAG TPA: AfsR/SARP family transcriptional regulator, partial [Acidimicrobiia bacterium]|nr:AfsR/SARP family transcriptional regulator [Acidimicrobiia bacterium]
MQFLLLGHLEVASADRYLSIGGPKQRALLTALLLNRNQFVSADRLIEAIWGDHPPPSAAHALEVYASEIRRLLGDTDRLIHEQGAYKLRVEDGERDIDHLEKLMLQGRSARSAGKMVEARTAFGRALDLWRGDLLDGLTDISFMRGEAERLTELRLEAIEEKVEADLALGQHAEVVGELQSLVSIYPLRERLWAQLMLALYRSGRQAEALRAYQRVRRVLGDELGIEPGEELKKLEEEILVHAPDLQLITPRRHNLPAATSSFVGRKQNVAEALRVLDSARLLTLTGP